MEIGAVEAAELAHGLIDAAEVAAALGCDEQECAAGFEGGVELGEDGLWMGRAFQDVDSEGGVESRNFVASIGDDRVMAKPWDVRRLRDLIRRRLGE